LPNLCSDPASAHGRCCAVLTQVFLPTLGVRFPPVEMYLRELVSMRETTSRQDWSHLWPWIENIYLDEVHELVLRGRLGGELGGVTIIPQDGHGRHQVIVGED
jgi:hypothetical protein